MLQKYKTLIDMGEAEIIEKKSRFIGTAAPVADECAALELISSCKKKFRDASHNAYAYQIGDNDELQRMSDDGEPSGTAGLPILDILKAGDLKNTVVIVTRYFGGTLLGTGGLVRAYGRAAKEAIVNAGVAELILHREVTVTLDYSLSEKVMRNAQQSGLIIKNSAYTEVVKITLLISACMVDSYEKTITDLTNGRAGVTLGGWEYSY